MLEAVQFLTSRRPPGLQHRMKPPVYLSLLVPLACVPKSFSELIVYRDREAITKPVVAYRIGEDGPQYHYNETSMRFEPATVAKSVGFANFSTAL